MYPPPLHPGHPHAWAPPAMMADARQAGIPPYCETPTSPCTALHSQHLPCAWSCPVSRFYDQAAPGAANPAAQLAMLQEQMMSQLGPGYAPQGGAAQGMAPTTVAETDRLIGELEATVQQLRLHRAALERLGGG